MLRVQFRVMPAFTAAKRLTRRRRTDTIWRTAIDFGVDERTLRRWIARPNLRPVLRAYRYGKQWRLHVPETHVEFELYKQEVLSAVGPFHRRHKKRWEHSTTGKQIRARLGFGNERT